MLFCANCTVKNCAKIFGQEEEYPRACPTEREEIDEFQKLYDDPLTRLLARESAIANMDYFHSRAEQIVMFARGCHFKKIGIAFCISLSDYGQKFAKFLRSEGFEVESVICKVGHKPKTSVDVSTEIDNRGKSMCNPVAQAEFLNQANTDLNVAVGLCVGHDSLFYMYSKAPVVTLIAKDHRYQNCPARFFDEGMQKYEG